MSDLGFYHHIHGNRTHNLFILHAKNYLVLRGAKVKDPTVFKKRVPPCEPDIYYEYSDHGKTFLRVLEVESNPTKESVERKQRQYTETLRGVILDVISVNEFWKYSEGKADWNLLEKFFEERLPI